MNQTAYCRSKNTGRHRTKPSRHGDLATWRLEFVHTLSKSMVMYKAFLKILKVKGLIKFPNYMKAEN